VLICLMNMMNMLVSQKWECCEVGLADGALQLKDLEARLKQSTPELDHELPIAEQYNQVGGAKG